MKPANFSTRRFEKTKLLSLDSGSKTIRHARLGDLSDLLNKDDLLVINNSGTLPSSFQGLVQRSNEPIEIRLAAFQGQHLQDFTSWIAISFGEGHWRQTTESRRKPPVLFSGDKIIISKSLHARVKTVTNKRILLIEFESPNLIKDLFLTGKPIQYSYLNESLNLWDQQTIFNGPPLSVEPPSAGLNFNFEIYNQLKSKGIQFAYLSHGAGLSSTGDPALDQKLPLEECYFIPDETIGRIALAQKKGKNIIALGTTVIRALESAYKNKAPKSGFNKTSLKISDSTHLNVVTQLITGMHELGSSHRQILQALAPKPLVEKAYTQASTLNYLNHEFGDLCLVS